MLQHGTLQTSKIACDCALEHILSKLTDKMKRNTKPFITTFLLNQCQHLVIKLPSGQKTQAIFRIIAHEYMGTTLYSNAEAQVKLLSIFNQFKEYMNSP